jgi:predicted Na+-dependent transporter
MGLAVFFFTLGAFLKVDQAAFQSETANKRWIAAVLAWTTFGVPLVMLSVVRLFAPEPDLARGLMLCMLAPPVGSAAAIAAMLGLSAPLALLASVAATIVSPLYLPPLASWFAGYDLAIDPLGMLGRLLLIVGGACATATLIRRYAARFVAENPHAMTGVAVLGLILVALGAMRGMQTYFLLHPEEVVGLLALAFAVNAGFQVLSAALFASAGRLRALTVGLVSGNRNVTLAWAAAGASLLDHPRVELYLAMSVLPIFVLPAPSRWLVRRLLDGAPSLPIQGPAAASMGPELQAGLHKQP